MEVMMERTRGWGGAYGEVLSLCLGRQIEQRNKKERGNNKLALGSHRFIFRCNNQLIQWRGHTVRVECMGGCCLFVWGRGMTKNTKIKYNVDLDGCRSIITSNKQRRKRRGGSNRVGAQGNCILSRGK
jgi:hypothetical protein